MRHEDVRAMLSAGETSAELDAHLGSCADCTAYADTLASIKRAAADAYAETPPDLADAVLAGVRAAAAAGVVVPIGDAEATPLSPASASPEGNARWEKDPSGNARWEKDPNAKARQWWQRAAARAAVAAVVAGAVAAAALTLPGREDASTSLVAAAGATERAKTARFTMTAEMRFEPSVDVPGIDLDAARRELRDAPREIRRALERELERMERQLRESLTDVTGEVRADGEIVFPDRMRVEGTMRSSAPTLFGGGSLTFEAIAIGDRSWLRSGRTGDEWLRVPSSPVSVRYDLHPVKFLDAIRAHGGQPEDLGLETLDGEAVRHWRFEGTEPGITDAATVIDVWVAESDGLMRRARSTGSAETGAGKATFTTEVRFYDFGADVAIRAPKASGSLPGDLSSFGFSGGSFRFAVPTPPAMPRPRFSPMPAPSFEPYPTPSPYEWTPSPYPTPSRDEWTPSPYPTPSEYRSPTFEFSPEPSPSPKE